MNDIFINHEPTISARFISAGTFIHSSGWRHEERVNNSYELIIPLEGTLSLTVGDENLSITPNSIAIIPPNTRHIGTNACSEFIRFNWIHFTIENATTSKINLLTQELLNEIGMILPTFSTALAMSRIHVIVSQLLDIYQITGPKSYLDNLLCNVLYEISMQETILIQENISTTAAFQPVKEWIRIHATEPLKLAQLATFFGYNPSYLSRVYRQKMGITITNEIKNYRIAQSKAYLLNTNLTIDEIANEVGYQDAKYFMRTFKKRESITPSEFRQAYQRRHLNQK